MSYNPECHQAVINYLSSVNLGDGLEISTLVSSVSGFSTTDKSDTIEHLINTGVIDGRIRQIDGWDTLEGRIFKVN